MNGSPTWGRGGEGGCIDTNEREPDGGYVQKYKAHIERGCLQERGSYNTRCA
jgi:hypothetical protein